jgi:serine/threonine protein kinase/RNA polymerase subunit RPABC4/transcription elongation factor Spt4
MPACARCGAVNPHGARFCGQCSGALDDAAMGQRACPDCGRTIPAGSSECPRCVRHENPGPAHPIADEMLRSGDVLGTRYQVVRALGRGGMGAVYEVTDSRLGDKRWALKVLSSVGLDAASRTAAFEAFTREATLLAGLSHPNLPSVVDFFTEGNRHCLTMEYIDGLTLEAVMRQAREPLPERRVVAWAMQLCAVLSYLHAWTPPIVFRDLKPSNIMLLKGERIKLVDFGIARHFRQGQHHDTAVLGTHGFAAMESYGTGQSDARSDVYSLGATLYYLLSGDDPSSHPFVFAPLRSRRAELSPSIAAIVARAVQVEPGRRFQSMEAVRNSLHMTVRLAAPIADTADWQTGATMTNATAPAASSTLDRAAGAAPGATLSTTSETASTLAPIPSVAASPKSAQSSTRAEAEVSQDTRARIRCPRCDAVLSRRALFCGACAQPLSGSLADAIGQPTTILCKQCQSVLPAHARFCGACGTPAQERPRPGDRTPELKDASAMSVTQESAIPSAKSCPRCGRVNPVGRWHCSGCGAALPPETT